MSFFRNIRSSITRGKSSSRDTTPVRATTAASSHSVSSSRPASVHSRHSEGRRDSLDSRADSSILNRGETFILNSDQEDQQRNSSNSSTLEKKSKKSKVLSKFSTFTKRKKTPPESSAGTTTNVDSFEHHPSDNATNTYYKCSAVDYDAQSDPFNFLYEQHSSLKLLQHGIDPGEAESKPKQHGFFDSSTYRKGKATSQLKAQLEQLKTQQSSGSELHEEEPDQPESEKYKTVTLNSFRKSFRDKYLQQQHEAPHNPAWCVEVEAPEKAKDPHERQDSKENRPDYLIFENENYRPGSRSPVRERNSSPSGGGGGRQSRSTTRSPVKRNETFRVERPEVTTHKPPHISTTTTSVQQCDSGPSIRVEIKNSVMPRAASGRIVPVGVAKPMPSLPRPKATRAASPPRNAGGGYKTHAGAAAGKYQTLVQINNHNSSDHNAPTAFNRRQSRSNSTRIQLGGTGGLNNATNKFSNSIGSRYSYAAPTTVSAVSNGLSAYELLRASNNSNTNKSSPQQQRLKPTYFGGDITTTQQHQQHHHQQQQPTRLMMSPSTTIRTASAGFGNNHQHHHHHNYGNGHSSNLANTGTSTINGINIHTSNITSTGTANTKLATNTKLRHHHSPKRSSSTTLSTTLGPISGYLNRRDLHQPRFTPVPVVQRRSRSPIKLPWR